MEQPEFTLATRVRYPRESVGEVLEGIEQVLAAKRGKTASFSGAAIQGLDEDMLAVILGPTGNLRAPSIRVGTTLVVGFEAQMFGDFFGS